MLGFNIVDNITQNDVKYNVLLAVTADEPVAEVINGIKSNKI